MVKWQHAWKVYWKESTTMIKRFEDQIDDQAQRGIWKWRSHKFPSQNLLPLIKRHLSLMRFITVFPSTFIPRFFSIFASFSIVWSLTHFKIHCSGYFFDIPLPIKYFFEKSIFIHSFVPFTVVNMYPPAADIDWTI